MAGLQKTSGKDGSRRRTGRRGENSSAESQARRLVDALEALIGREMRPRKEIVDAMLDFSPPEMRGLMWLGRAGMAVMSDFAQGIGVPLSTATRIVNRMVKKGLVVRRRSDLDRRIVEVDLSPVAYEYKDRFMAERVASSAAILGGLTLAERETMLSLMEKALRMSAPVAALVSGPISAAGKKEN